jgi:hypothetical protein
MLIALDDLEPNQDDILARTTFVEGPRTKLHSADPPKRLNRNFRTRTH